jgi:hypothetical protein
MTEQLPLYPGQRQTAKELPWYRQWLLDHGRSEKELGPVDPRPPDTEGLNYTGNDCRRAQHERCPGYWPADPTITGKWGHGSRCVCPCHERQEGASGGEAIEQR